MTSKAPRAPFRAIDPKTSQKPSQAEIAAFAAERGAPKLAAKPVGEVKPAAPAGQGAPAPTPVQPAPAVKSAAKPAPRGETFRLNLEAPAYLKPQLRERAYKDECSILSIVLRALEKDGFKIEAADLVRDRRKAER